MNFVLISGRLGRELELKRTQTTGAGRLDFSIANKSFGKGGERTTWVRCRALGKVAEAMAAHVTKGQMVWLQGSWASDSWEKDGQKHNMEYLLVWAAEWDPRAGGTPDPGPEAPSEDDGVY
jgi:single-stranded DNA-binding protein